MAWELVSKEDAKTIHPLADSVPDFWSNVVETMIREHLSAPNLGTSVEVTEVHSGDGTPVLVVGEPPIMSVSSLLVNTVSLDANDYIVFEGRIQLKNENFPRGNLNIEVTYMSGSVTVPYQIQMTAAAMLAAISNYAGRHGADSSIKWALEDINTQQGGEPTPNVNVGLTSHLEKIMKRMLRRKKVRVK